MKHILKIIVVFTGLLFVAISCDSGKQKMLIPPDEGPEDLLSDIGIAVATVDAEITIDTTLEPVKVDEAADITIEPYRTPERTEFSSNFVFFHKCKKGDALIDVAKKYKINLNELAKINNRTENRPLTSGQILLLPRNVNNILNAEDVTTYTVVGGDTYSKIARKFHVAGQALMTINEAKNSSLNIGDVLYVPDISKK